MSRNLPARRLKVIAASVTGLAATISTAALLLVAGAPAAAAPSVYVSTTGSDTAACTATAPCKSFNTAFRTASPGQVVEVAGGNYPQQTINADASKTSQDDVVFQPAPGAVVTIGCDGVGTSCLDVYASHITFDGGDAKAFKTQTYTANGFQYQGRIDTERGADDVTFRNLDVGAFTAAATHMQVVGNDLGPSVDPLNNLVVSDATGIVITDNLIHDYLIENGGHFECMYWQGVTGVYLAYNEFRSCAVYGIHSKEGDTFSSKDVTVDHNVFWNPRGLTTQADVQLTTEILPCSGSTVTNNVFTDGLINECSPTSKSGNTTRSQTDPAPVSPIRTGTVTPTPPPVVPPTCDALCKATDKIARADTVLKNTKLTNSQRVSQARAILEAP